MLKMNITNCPMAIFVVPKIHTPPSKERPAHTEKITKKI
uniref:Uncharacterized protein n=1 Tax=viral metagenome TaxID=1070528 RepID=A0A6C0KTS8_9ZZZZ